MFDFVTPCQMNEERPSEGSLETLGVARKPAVQYGQLLGEEIKTMALQPQPKHSRFEASSRDSRSKDFSQNIAFGK